MLESNTEKFLVSYFLVLIFVIKIKVPLKLNFLRQISVLIQMN